MDRRLSACVWMLGLLALTACSHNPFEVTEPDFTGTVGSVEVRQSEVAAELISVDPPQPSGPGNDPLAGKYATKIVWVNGSTIIGVLQRDGTVRRGTLADIRVGSRLLVKTNGTEMRSLPPQYIAVRVEVRP